MSTIVRLLFSKCWKLIFFSNKEGILLCGGWNGGAKRDGEMGVSVWSWFLKERKNRQVWSNNILHVFTYVLKPAWIYAKRNPHQIVPIFCFVFLYSTYFKSVFSKALNTLKSNLINLSLNYSIILTDIQTRVNEQPFVNT